MKSNQELLSESRALVKQIDDEDSIKKCRSLIEEFIEKIEIWPSLTTVITSLEPKRIATKNNLLALEKKAQKEIAKTYKQLTRTCKTKQIDIPQSIIDAYDQKIVSSSGYTGSRFDAVRNLLFLLNDRGEISSIKKLAIFSHTEGIYKCTFSPSYVKWHEEKDNEKKTAWYSFNQLIYLKNTPSRLLFIEDYPLEDDDRYATLQHYGAIMLLMEPNETMQKYKVCVKILHEYMVSSLLGKEKAPNSYDKNKGILIHNGTKILFKPAQLRGKTLTLLYPKGKQCTKAIPFDEIYDKAIKSEADPCWDNLDITQRTKIKKQIFEIYEGINDRVSKKTNEPYLSAEDLNLHFA